MIGRKLLDLVEIVGLNELIDVLPESALSISGNGHPGEACQALIEKTQDDIGSLKKRAGHDNLFAELPSILLRFEAGVAVDRPDREFYDMPTPHYHQYCGFGLIKLYA